MSDTFPRQHARTQRFTLGDVRNVVVSPDGARVVLEALKLPLDTWMGPVTKDILENTLKDDVNALRQGGLKLDDNPNARAHLAGTFEFPKPPKSDAQKSYGPTRKLEGEDNRVYGIGKEVYLRDAHCATCHQANGKGGGPIKPLDGSAVVLDDDKAKQIKILLNGAGNGAMPSWKQLSDTDIAAVISFTKNNWSNKTGQLVQPAEIKASR